ncbi:hypothetical protein B0H14DRAFT_2643845 [Mycena olivaceomarginata]|nr:hypothetical protein B0H14DRAFT_2643845 [Mycena olivaceomarginata]
MSQPQLEAGYYAKFNALQGEKNTYYASGLNGFETVEYAIRAGIDVAETYFPSINNRASWRTKCEARATNADPGRNQPLLSRQGEAKETAFRQVIPGQENGRSLKVSDRQTDGRNFIKRVT